MSERNDDGFEHDPAISAIYRKAGDLAPPSPLDEAILSAAKRAAWRRKHRWTLPLSTAAIVLLSITLLLKTYDEGDFSPELTESGAPSPSLPADSPQASTLAQKRKASEPAAPRELIVEEERYPVERKKIIAEQTPPVVHSSVEAKAESTAQSARGLVAESQRLSEGSATSSEAPTKQAARTRAESVGVLSFSDDFMSRDESQDSEIAEKEKDAAMPSSEPIEPILKKSVSQPMAPFERLEQEALEPKPWLEKIRKLVEDGEIEAARKELDSFKKRYPEYTLPDELKSLSTNQ